MQNLVLLYSPDPMLMRLMQVHKSSSGDKPILPQPFDFSRYAGRQSKLLMRTDVKRREIWEWSDHTRWPTVSQDLWHTRPIPFWPSQIPQQGRRNQLIVRYFLYILWKSIVYIGDTQMILVAGGIKGGSGKTTVATNLAIIRALQGCDVLLIDADDQETATDFTVLRNERRADGAGYTSIKLTGSAVRTETLRLAAKYDDIVIDTGGRDTSSQRAALTVADVLLVPFVPRSFDVWTLEKVAALVDEMQTVNPKLKALTFLNRADPRGHDNVEAQEVLKETHALQFIDTPLGARKAFSNAAALGMAVTEIRPSDPKADAEILLLYRYILDMQSISTLTKGAGV